MRRSVLRAAFALAVSTGVVGAQSADTTRAAVANAPKDSFVGLDKPKHFLLSFFIESASFAAIQAGGGGRRPSFVGASAVTSVFGLGREIHDRRTKGLFSLGDLAWDGLGAAAAVVMLRHTYR